MCVPILRSIGTTLTKFKNMQKSCFIWRHVTQKRYVMGTAHFWYFDQEYVETDFRFKSYGSNSSLSELHFQIDHTGNQTRNARILLQCSTNWANAADYSWSIYIHNIIYYDTYKYICIMKHINTLYVINICYTFIIHVMLILRSRMQLERSVRFCHLAISKYSMIPTRGHSTQQC